MWRATEAFFESTVPIGVASTAWWYIRQWLGAMTPGRPFTPLEQAAILGGGVALASWAISRQFFLIGYRNPRALIVAAWVGCGAILAGLPLLTDQRFIDQCTAVSGEVMLIPDFAGQDQRVCRVGGVPENVYLPGALLRPAWTGPVHPIGWALLAGVAALAAIAFRDQRLKPTQIGQKVHSSLRLAAARGPKSALGKPAVKSGAVQACANLTLWGEVCGQLYSAEKVFEAGEWCLRCQQRYTRAERTLELRVVSLFSGDVDVLNGLERLDTVSWRQGEPMPPDARLSGQERWVELGKVSFPDVISVAQALALLEPMLLAWSSSAQPEVQKAASLAVERASRVAAWVWVGPVAHRLTYARPTAPCLYAVGATRLRDLVGDAAEELTLQLDIGLFPLELRLGFRKVFADPNRAPEVQNSKLNLWIPVSPPSGVGGKWVPRMEGQALRTWLATDRIRAEEKGGTTPLPYAPYQPEFTPVEPAETLDFVRMAIAESGEPAPVPEVGVSISEWDWFEPEQIQLLRQQCLVMVEAP